MTVAQRMDRRTKTVAAAGVVGLALLWVASYHWLPTPPIAYEMSARLTYAAGWIAVAGLFGLTMAVEAVAHERLQTDAFDPLADHSTRRIEVNQRYLQNTLEQFVLFTTGLVGLAAGVGGMSEGSVRAIAASAITWVLSRYLFWIGYHRSSAMRVVGIAGLAQSMLILIWLVVEFGSRHWGVAGIAFPLAALAAIEFTLVRSTRAR